MIVMEALQWANHKLKEHRDTDEETGHQLDSPMLDVEVLLASALGVSKSWLFTHFDHELRPHEQERFERMIERRILHEPVAYIVGEKEFYKRMFQVNRFTLIPRSATETLVEEALRIAKIPNSSTTWFADIGTGSGAIAVTLAAESGLPVIATDINNNTLALASQNAIQHSMESHIVFQQGDLLQPILDVLKCISQTNKPVPQHIILCANLPYLTTFQWQTAQSEMRDYEPCEALEAGMDGLDAYWKFFRQIFRARLELPLSLTTLIEIDPGQIGRIIPLIQHDFPNASPRILKDLDGFDRVVVTEL